MSAIAEPTVEQRVADNLGLARKAAGHYARRSRLAEFDDLYQVACLGLVLAAQRYDPSRSAFTTFAYKVMNGEIRRYFRDKCWPIHVSRYDREREYDDPEREALVRSWIAGALQPRSFDTPIGVSPRGDVLTLAETLGGIDTAYEQAEARIDRTQAMRRLSTRERQVMYLYYHEDLPQRTIAHRIGCSQMHVSRILRQAREKLGLDTNGKED